MNKPSSFSNLDKTHMMLINDIARMFGARMKKAADELNIPSGYRHMLIYLAHHDGVSQYELAKCSHLTAPTVSVTLQKMERDGYIERRPDENDQRQMNVFLTPMGRALEEQTKNKANETELFSMSCLNDEEKKIFKEYLLRVSANIQSLFPSSNDFPPRKE